MFGLSSDTKLDFTADGFARKESMKGTTVKNFWSPTQKNPEIQKDIATKLDLIWGYRNTFCFEIAP